MSNKLYFVSLDIEYICYINKIDLIFDLILIFCILVNLTIEYMETENMYQRTPNA